MDLINLAHNFLCGHVRANFQSIDEQFIGNHLLLSWPGSRECR